MLQQGQLPLCIGLDTLWNLMMLRIDNGAAQETHVTNRVVGPGELLVAVSPESRFRIILVSHV
eukprot:647076-Amphidinium_carterae.1